MIKKKIEEIVITLPEKLDNVIKKIDKSGLGIVFVIDDNGRLKASVTDGDIRRFYLKKKNYQI